MKDKKFYCLILILLIPIMSWGQVGQVDTSSFNVELVTKRIEILRDTITTLHRYVDPITRENKPHYSYKGRERTCEVWIEKVTYVITEYADSLYMRGVVWANPPPKGEKRRLPLRTYQHIHYTETYFTRDPFKLVKIVDNLTWRDIK